MDQAGLRCTSSNKPVPLKSVDVEVEIQGYVADVKAVLKYSNEEDKPIEAVFVFPLDDQSAVYRFEALVEDRLIVGECQEKEQAKQTYEDAIQAGKSAFLLEESDESSDVFTCLVGNLPPKTDAAITFAYVIELGVEADDAVKFVLPSVLNPRYGGSHISKMASAGNPSGPGPSGHTAASNRLARPTHAEGSVPYQFGFSCIVKGTLDRVEGVTSEDNFRVQKENETSARIMMTKKFTYDHDLGFLLYYERRDREHIVYEPGNPQKNGLLVQDVVMFNCIPEYDRVEFQGQGEYIFILDRSGSMMFDKITQAKKTLKECLKLLPVDCYLNIISFGTTHKALYDSGSKKNSNEVIKKAKNDVAKMAADMGGTNILAPLEFALEKEVINRYPRQIFLLTDGEVWNTAACIELVKKHSLTTRVFTFGIGFGASTSLVKGLARAGHGKAQFVADGDIQKLPEMVAATVKCATQPAATDVSVEVILPKHCTAIRLPENIPPIYIGERLIFYAIITCGKGQVPRDKKGTLILEYRLGGKRHLMERQLPFSLNGDSSESDPIHRLAAKAQIKQLQDDEGTTEKNKDKILQLSIATNLVSKYTSYVGVDKDRPELIEEEMERRDVPLLNTDGVKRKKNSKGKHPAKKRKTEGSSSGSSAAGPPPGSSGGFRGRGRGFMRMGHSGLDSGRAVGGGMIATPMAGGPMPGSTYPRLYGGGSSDSKLAEKYLGLVCDEEPTVEEGAAGPTTPVRSRPTKRKSKKKLLTVKKLHVQRKSTKEWHYVRWSDNQWYPVTIIRPVGNRMCLVRFRDSVTRKVARSTMVSAEWLVPGTVVGVNQGTGIYDLGIIVNYQPDSDEFLVANIHGKVYRVHASRLMLSADSAHQLLNISQSGHGAPGVVLCQYDETAITTEDIAELTNEGWLNYSLVHFWISYLWNEKLQPEDAHRTFCFVPSFFKNLVLPGDGPRSGKPTRHSNQRMNFDNVDNFCTKLRLQDTDIIFVPIHDNVTHWYLIAVKLEKGKQKNSRICSFMVMDSYFEGNYSEEVSPIRGVLAMLAQQQGLQLEFAERVMQCTVPLQTNDSDCGVCMIQCIEQCFSDGLNPRPHLDWFTPDTLIAKRKEMAKAIMALWAKENMITTKMPETTPKQ